MFSHYLAYFVIEMLLSVGLKLAPTFRLGKAESTEGAVDIEYGNIENGIIETGTLPPPPHTHAPSPPHLI